MRTNARAEVEASILGERCERVTRMLGGRTALIFSGHAAERNFPANAYPFRASSHFLYLAGQPIEGAVLELGGESRTIYLPEATASDRLWHGEPLNRELLEQETGARICSLADIKVGKDSLSLPVAAGRSQAHQQALLGRLAEPNGADFPLTQAMIEARLVQDAAAVGELEAAASVTSKAHVRGMQRTRRGEPEWTVRSAMLSAALEEGCTVAYQPIVTTSGNVLHQHDCSGVMKEGDLLLVDFGAERPSGYACDVTRTWPVTGTFSATQRALYQVVLAAQLDAISAARTGTRYRDVHLRAARTLCEGLKDFGLLKDSVEASVEEGAYALFFPHGIGHLIGLDVHDMEDLGDAVGYPEGRARDPQFGLNHLRLDRDLLAGMTVTVEPGFYCVPAILDDPARAPLIDRFVDRDVLSAVRTEVKGIRIEDVVVVGDNPRVLTAAIPKSLSEVEACVTEGALS